MPAPEREVSYGGVVVRGEEVIVIVPRGRQARARAAEGRPEPRRDAAAGGGPRGAARRRASTAEVRDGSARSATCYQRDGRRIDKVVHFFLCVYEAGDTADHDHEVEEARWMPLREARRRLSYRGEREMVGRALSALATKVPPACRSSTSTRRSSRTSSSAAARPRRSASATSRTSTARTRLRARDDRLPALAARADLPGRDRLRSRSSASRSSRRATSSTTTPSSAAHEEMINFLEQIYGRKVVAGRHRHGRALLARSSRTRRTLHGPRCSASAARRTRRLPACALALR